MSTSAGRVLMIPKGDYDATATYTMLDVVSYQGKSYVAKQTTTGNAPTNTTYWQLMIDAQGHTIKDSTTTFPNRANLVFEDFYIEDDSTNNATKIYKTKPVSLVSWATGTDAEIKEMIDAYYAGEITLADIQTVWAIGDERAVQLSAMEATGVGESHAAQTVRYVIMNWGGKTLSNGNDCLAVIGQKDCLSEKGYMNSTNTNVGSWPDSARRGWCNSTYKAAIPQSFAVNFKEFNNKSGVGGGGSSGTLDSTDYFALPAEIEVTGSYANSYQGEGSQFKYYETSENRRKRGGDGGSLSSGDYFMRSPGKQTAIFLYYLASVSNAYASNTHGIAPYGCI